MTELIAIDICNTLADVNLKIREMLGEKFNACCYENNEINDELFRAHLKLFTDAPVIDGALEGVRELTRGKNMIYLTARPFWAHAITKAWLNQYGFPKAPIIHARNKAETARALGVILAVDDAPKEIDKLVKVCRVMVHAQPYNRGYAGRFTWKDLLLKNAV